MLSIAGTFYPFRSVKCERRKKKKKIRGKKKIPKFNVNCEETNWYFLRHIESLEYGTKLFSGRPFFSSILIFLFTRARVQE